MSNTFKTLPMLAVFSGMMLAGILGSSAPSIADEPRDVLSADSPELAQVTVGPGFMDVQLHSEPKRSTLRIAGPQGYAMTIRAEGQIYITADLLLDAEPSRHKLEEIEAAKARGVENPGTANWQALPEGTYVYEIIADDGTGRPDKQVGRFIVEGGSVTLLDDRQSSAYQPNWIERVAGAALDFLVPSAHAQGGSFDNWVDILDTSDNDFTDITLHNTSTTNVAMFNDGGELKFGTGTAGSDDVLMTFSAVLGKVGVHTEAPSELLHIASPGLNAASIRIENTSNAYNLNTGSSTGFSIQEVGTATPFRIEPGAPTSSIRVNSGGNVGIGTTSPGARLHVAGNAIVESTMQIGGTTTIQGNTTIQRDGWVWLTLNNQDSDANWRLGASDTGDFRLTDLSQTGSTDPFRIQNGAPNNSLRINSDGNVGIGTNSPSQNLEISSGARTAMIMNAPDGEQTDFTFQKGGTDRWAFRSRASNDNFEITRLNSPDGTDIPFSVNHSSGIVNAVKGMRVWSGSTPPTPGNGATLFVDQSDGNLKARFPNGNVVTIASN